MRKFLILIFLFIVGLVVYNYYASRDYTKESINLANEITDFLVKEGISDANIIKQYRKEVKEGNVKWVEFHKQLDVNFRDKWLDDLKTLSERNGCSVEKTIGQESIKLIIGKSGKKFSYLIFARPISKKSRRVAIVIDDAGYTKNIDDFLSMGIPVTFAILPGERYSAEISSRLKSAGVDFLMHLPMEPEDPLVNPGKRAVFLRMGEQEIEKIFNENLKTVPGAFGVSNHMGSGFSKSSEKMKILLSLVKKNNLVYFDSYTTPKSKANAVAKEMGLPVLVNQIFLDMEPSEKYIEKQLSQLLSLAKKGKTTIAIGHVHKKTLPIALKKHLPKFHENNIKFVSLKSLYDENLGN